MIDTHAHLNDEKLNAKKIIDEMHTDGLSKIITIGASPDDFDDAILIASKHSDVYACIGVHPYYADVLDDSLLKRMKELALGDKVVGIGEFGLDFHVDTPTRDVQKIAFEKQIRLAYEAKLPMCLHIRDAHGEALDILKKNIKFTKYGVIIHCFSGSREMAVEYVRLGFYISFSGSITYKKSNSEIVKAVPKDRILFETDAPYLSPQPLRGSVNEPKNTIITAKIVADLRGESFESLEQASDENVKRLFSKMK